MLAFAQGLLLVALTHLGLTRLRFGKAPRAAAEDPIAMATAGIDVRHIYTTTIGLAATLSPVGGVLIALQHHPDQWRRGQGAGAARVALTSPHAAGCSLDKAGGVRL